MFIGISQNISEKIRKGLYRGVYRGKGVGVQERGGGWGRVERVLFSINLPYQI